MNPEREAIIEVGAVKFRGDKVLGTWSSLVKPDRSIPFKIQRLTGIHQKEADQAPPISAVLGRVASFIRNYPLVGHNIAFDVSFLRRRGLRLPNPSIDTFELASILVPHASRYSLGKLAEELRVPYRRGHRALADAQTTRQLFLALLKRAWQLDIETIQEINQLATGSEWSLRQVFLDLEAQRARSAFTGTIRGQLAAKGVLSDEMPGPILARPAEKQPLEPSPDVQPLDTTSLCAMFEEGGLVARKFAGYEYRPQQVQMLRLVSEAFNQNQQLLLEAGTGTGKSLVYLLPAAYYSVANGRHVVISTNTINLQDQLFHKDIPDLQRILSLEFKAALLKGRSNYLCLRRLASLRRQPRLPVDEIRVLAKILVWLPGTTSGDRAELNLMGDESPVWARLSAENESCRPDLCSYADRCYLYRARQEAEEAHLIVVNHSLLLSDMLTDHRLLPRYQHLIIDEAHHLEDVSTHQLSFQIDQGRMLRLLMGLTHTKGDREHGLIPELGNYLRDSTVPAHIRTEAERHLEEIQQLAEGTRRSVYAFFTALSLLLEEHHRPGSRYDQRIRLTNGLRVQPAWSDVEIAWENLSTGWLGIGDRLQHLYNGLQGMEDAGDSEYEDLLQELYGNLHQVRQLREETEAIISQPAEGGIYWASISADDETTTLHAAPLHVGEQLESQLYRDKDCLILTSATLSAGHDFSYIRDRLNLWQAEELTIGSPFDYVSSTLLYIPTDIPEPGQPHYQKSVSASLRDLGLATRGRTIVLFTSYSQLRATHRVISRPLGDEGIAVLGQGIDGSRRSLLRQLKANPESVILGTRSYWEGIDVVGEALSCLVIARLPFPVPTDPIFAARGETFEDPFNQFAVPQTLLRFRQGFGRLIRSKTDRGVVALLDKRVLTKSYGRAFLEAIPQCTVRQGSIHDLPQLAAEWIAGQVTHQQGLEL